MKSGALSTLGVTCPAGPIGGSRQSPSVCLSTGAVPTFAGQRPFFCLIEAIETLIWLTEVARSRRQYADLWRPIDAANAEANPELFRIGVKMANGAGKTTVMAMIIVWQTLNAVRMPASRPFLAGIPDRHPGAPRRVDAGLSRGHNV
jgi:hypothetical protein